MKKKIAILAALGVMTAGSAYGSGYRVPEQSINAVALSNAYIANTEGPDTAYYNPANMAWQENRWQVEASINYINLTAIDYTAENSSNVDTSKTEDIFFPMFHAVSPDFNNFRFGFSITVPYGLSKRWNDPVPRLSAEEFTLHVFEANPTVAYKFNDRFSVAAGPRVLYTRGKVLSDGIFNGISLSRSMEGNTIEYGYNLAMTVKPTKEWTLAATYRSKVDLDVEGHAKMAASISGGLVADRYDDDVSVTIPAPAVSTLATSYTFDKTTVELTWDRTYWSKYEELDFDYGSSLTNNVGATLIAMGLAPAGTNPLSSAFDAPKDKDWHDSNAYRIGITHKCTEKLTAMLGFAYDETPIPDDTLGFELPGSDGIIYSIGCRYKVNNNLEVGGAYLYDYKKSREITTSDSNINGIDGTFEDAGAHVVNLGLIYKF